MRRILMGVLVALLAALVAVPVMAGPNKPPLDSPMTHVGN